jgi:hypothetical protein
MFPFFLSPVLQYEKSVQILVKLKYKLQDAQKIKIDVDKE